MPFTGRSSIFQPLKPVRNPESEESNKSRLIKITYIRRLYCATVFLISFIAACAQLPDYHLQIFDYPSGIRPDEITAVAKDQKKMLWILYRTQVQSFDGKAVQNFKPAAQLYTMLCDKAGRVWVGSEHEIFLFSEITGTFKAVPVPDKTNTLETGAVIELPDGRIWLLTSHGFFEFDAQHRFFKSIEQFIPQGSIVHVRNCALYNNTVFVNADDKVYRHNITTGETDFLPAREVYGMYPVSEDSMMISTWVTNVQWYNFSIKKITPASLGSGITPSFSLRSVAAISASRFLVASSEGILEYDASRKAFIQQNFFLNGRKVATKEYASYIFYDQQDGYAWIASTEGIARFAVTKQPIGLIKIRQVDDEISANMDDVRQIVQDQKGDLWMATGFGFACWQKSKNKWLLFPPAKNDKNALSHESVRGLLM